MTFQNKEGLGIQVVAETTLQIHCVSNFDEWNTVVSSVLCLLLCFH